VLTHLTLDPEEETGAESSSSCGFRWVRTDNKNIIVAVAMTRTKCKPAGHKS